MVIRDDLRQKHLEAWTRALREFKPDDVDQVANLPEVELDGVTVRSAIRAGWIADVDDPDVVGDMRGGDIARLSADIWKAFNEARRVDPN